MNKVDTTRYMLNKIRNPHIITENKSTSYSEDTITRNMIKRINEHIDTYNKKKLLTEDNQFSNNSINIEKIPSFSQTISDWKTNIKQNIQSNINFDSFLYYSDKQDIVINFTISDMNDTKVQMRLNDSSGNGIYIWINGLQLNDTNLPKIQHIKASYDNWRSGLIKDSTVLNDLKKFIENK